jgi:hypothetical protein
VCGDGVCLGGEVLSQPYEIPSRRGDLPPDVWQVERFVIEESVQLGELFLAEVHVVSFYSGGLTSGGAAWRRDAGSAGVFSR